ncbi:hypothetical protein DAPPUDRAFT_248708 [Daphnia pulex]|uniref:Uncharacterized protein n=1 Tax=Daphnia pulex TaxID=6669 RepID=E9GV22_DAPPU|nr:hypothetical protein DAPPUDRAFT_248708 [Daphnia pulex]|eukprot:EFX76589.1 hypothetical protein DAPPUDRAFT_248708 [Daphnia pulex]
MVTEEATYQELQAEIDYVAATEEEVSDAKQNAAALQLQQQQHAASMQQLIAAIPTANPAPGAPNAPATTATTRLPQRQIKHFKGDVLEWTQFWESFNAAIHGSSLTAAFDYLKEYLKGEAHLIVENLELTDANYTIAIAELKRNYGQPKVLIDAHFNKLDSLQPVKDGTDVAALRTFYLQIQSNINALETLGVAKTTFGGLLGSRLIKLIPHNLQAEWVKSATNDATDIESVITF